MVVMALDHVRDFFHFSAVQGFEPTDLTRASGWIFFSRWITHFCAPIFSFLAGTGTFLAVMRGKPKATLSWFLVTRGLWLIGLELTVFVWFGWDFNIHPHSYVLATLWALGTSMVLLAGLIHLPTWVSGLFGAVLILGHNAFDRVTPSSWGAWAPLWNVLHVPGVFQTGGCSIFAFYPLIPWLGVMAAGYAFGGLYKLSPEARRAWLWRLGLALTAAFVIVRFANVYGDPAPWSHQPRPGFTLLSFLNVTKYPPSLCYLLMTLGPGTLLLAAWDGGHPAWLDPFIVFGRVPFFYYILHIPLIHGLSYAFNYFRFGHAEFTGITLGIAAPPTAGVSLVTTYLIWIGVVAALYPACRWFAGLKRRRRDLTWLSYF